MIKWITRRLQFGVVGLAASFGLIALGAAVSANAACMATDSLLPARTAAAGPVHLLPAVYQPGANAGPQFLAVHDSSDNDSIVGLWQFKLDGFAVDWGTQAWHSDGTEIMFSGAQNPATGDVCQGAWRQVGRNTYTLNHIAMGWLAPNGGFGLRVHFHMVVRLDASGDSFSGSYKAAVYSVGSTDPFDESVQVASGTGSVHGSRVRPD